MDFDFQKIFDGKAAYRRKLAALPIGEKLTLLDAMRESTIAIRNSTLEPGSALLREDPVPYATKDVISDQ